MEHGELKRGELERGELEQLIVKLIKHGPVGGSIGGLKIAYVLSVEMCRVTRHSICIKQNASNQTLFCQVASDQAISDQAYSLPCCAHPTCI